MANKISRRAMTQTVNGKTTREAQKDQADRGKCYWWKQNEDGQETELANEIASTIKFIAKHQSGRTEQLTVGTRLYGNSNAFSIMGSTFSRSSTSTATPSASRISYNLCASVVDTLTAQVAKNKVVPTFITSGGVWGMQRKAENLSKFVEGMFYEQKIHEKVTYQFRDSACWGDGVLHIYRDSKNRAAVERVYPGELVVDLVESIVGPPRQLHRVKVVDRGILLDMFPESEEDILAASPSSWGDLGGDGSAADLITVAESWHLKSGDKATDGLKVISLPDTAKILDKKEYDKDYFPFAKLEYSKRLLGYWGQGACERLQNIQGEINRGMITIQKSQWLQAGPKVFLPIGSKIVSQHINNEMGAIIQGNEPPQYLVPPCVQPEVYSWVDSLIQKGYQQEGCSQLAANSVKPMGLDSGKAIRAYDQITDDRHMFLEQRIQDINLEVARQMIEIVKDVKKEGGKYKVIYPNSNFIEQIDWSDVDLEMDEYWLKAFPTSELPEEPSAKLQTVQEYMQAGMITPRAGRRLLAMPDVEMSDNLANAAEELICKSIEEILYDNVKGARPDDEWDLTLAKQLSLQYMNYAKLNNCPKSRLASLRKFMAYIDDALGLTAPPAPMPGQAGPPGAPGLGATGAPQANPQPTPTSDLVPNVAGAA